MSHQIPKVACIESVLKELENPACELKDIDLALRAIWCVKDSFLKPISLELIQAIKVGLKKENYIRDVNRVNYG